jgi:serine protease Do
MRNRVAFVSALTGAVGLGAACWSLGGGTAEAGQQIWRQRDPSQSAPAVAIPAQTSLAPLVKVLKPAVVNIDTKTVVRRRMQIPRGMEDYLERFYGRRIPNEDQVRSGLGSGFIISPDGYVLTNNHVIQGATEIQVTLSDDRKFTARVVGRDESTDIGLLKLENAKDLPTVPLGNSDALEQGDFVVALGNPLSFRGSVTFGIVSAKARSLRGSPYDDYIQTDAPINQGNSGGPLFNLQGEVVGINTAIISPQIGQGIGFAVPVNVAKDLLPQLQSKGKVARGWLGVSVGELDAEVAQGLGLPPGTRGALISEVTRDQPAERAGLRPGDVVTAVNGRTIESRDALVRGVAAITPGSKAKLNILRGKEKKEITVQLGEKSRGERIARGQPPLAEDDEPQRRQQPGDAREERLGIKVTDLTPNLAQDMGLQGDSGVVVSDVSPDGAAAKAGVEEGDLIMELNKKPVGDRSQFARSMAQIKPGEMALLRVRRAERGGSSAMYLAVRVPR